MAMRNGDMTTDEAVTLFQALLQQELRIDPNRRLELFPETPQQAEARRWRCAEALLRSVCAGPAHCGDPRCRRSRRCGHLLDVAALAEKAHAVERRTPGAVALRRAIRVWMMAQVTGSGRGSR
jgi:hypothetical protein